MAVAFLRVVSPPTEISSCLCFLEAVREGARLVNPRHDGGMKRKKPGLGLSFLYADFKYACVGFEPKNRGNFPIRSSLVANPAEVVISSEQKVYNVVLKQAALVKEQMRANSAPLDVRPDLVVPGTSQLMSEAYDRCGEVCAEYAKTFYLGTLLMTPERRKAIWAIYVWCRRTDELVDGPNASHITPSALDRWESRLEDLFDGRPYDMLDAALSDTVAKFPVDIQRSALDHQSGLRGPVQGQDEEEPAHSKKPLSLWSLTKGVLSVLLMW